MEIKTENGTIHITWHHYHTLWPINEGALLDVPQWGQGPIRRLYTEHPSKELRRLRRQYPHHDSAQYIIPSLYVRGLTLCTLTQTSSVRPKPGLGIAFRYGYAFCSARDTFRYSTGRKLALKRALSTLQSSLRSEVWDAYFAKFPLPSSYLAKHRLEDLGDVGEKPDAEMEKDKGGV